MPEMKVRKLLHSMGYRYKLYDPKFPGKPDLVFPKYKLALFVNGCFWHGHDCSLFRWPKTRSVFWRSKIDGNIARDQRNLSELLRLGWRVCTVWECELKGAQEALATEEFITLSMQSSRMLRPCSRVPSSMVSGASTLTT